MAKKKYWQSFGELNNSEANQKSKENEFPEELPFQGAEEKGLANAPASRRDFLKYLGFSTAAAVAAASCETPVRKAIPYVNKPGDLIPGVADYYATTYVNGGEVIPIVAKVRDGRPIKITGNTLCSFTKGGTSTRAQASVLDLYDTARLRHPQANNNSVAFEAVDKLITAELAGLNGAPIVLLTSTITSPTTKQIIDEFVKKYNGRHVQFDAVSYSGMLLANKETYGQQAIPTYAFENAKVVVSIGADFLGTWLNPVEYQHGYAAGRKLNQSSPDMSKHYQFESMMSMTGANADERFTHRPSETGLVAAALLSAVSGQGATGTNGKLKAGIEKAAADLVANRGRGLVVCGSNNRDIQIIVNAINEAIGANGSTINWNAPLLIKQGLDADIVTLVNDMEAGRVGGLFIYNANPAYEYFDSAKFVNALKRVKLTVSFNERKDETTALCKYVLPASNYLESWGDAEIKTGYFSLMQPTINPLFDTRQFQDSLLKLAGNATPYVDYFRNFWTAKAGGADTYNKYLQDGIVEPESAPAPATAGAAAFNNAGVAAAVTAANALKKNSALELVIYQKTSLGDGKHANNPWLLELPDPITRATWDNYVMVSPQFANQENTFGIDITKPRQSDKYEVNPEKPVVVVTVGGKKIELPILIVPGMNANTIAIAVGFGRSRDVGKAVWTHDGGTLGKNAYPLLSFNGTTFDWSAADASIEVTGREYRIAQVQVHGSVEGRHEVVRELTFDTYKKNPQTILEAREKELHNYGGLKNFERDGTIYPIHERPGVKWGMSIDLNSCFGCGACVVSCNAENNIPVVGKHEVARYHDMHWLRIDRYFSGNPNDPESIQTIFQPMPCQHCDNAPCENVCPVAATTHSAEGMNQMIYNRCIGTRYCANNCPYKVRRFNWADYTGADSFKDNQVPLVEAGKLDEVVLMMNDDLTRMVLNPDVTVRSRGVMEKCTFCVQRTQEGKLKAKKENRELADADVKTACQEACPADAITFGNIHNAESEISRTRRDNNGRVFYTLEQLHTLPGVSYLAKVRNAPALSSEAAHGNEVKGGEKSAEAAH